MYYAESRGAAGRNPFHEHEFEFEELRDELTRVFPHVSMFLENHVGGLAFQPDEPDTAVEVRVDAGQTAPAEANFFVAVCAHRTQLGHPTFVYVPAAGNVLRERERHIAKLEREVAAKNEWLADSERQRTGLLEAHRQLTAELERANQWTRSEVARLEAELERANQWTRSEVARLEAELQRANQWAEERHREVQRVEEELRRSNQWGLGEVARLEGELELARQAALAEAARLQGELERANQWALGLDVEIGNLRARRDELLAGNAALDARIGVLEAGIDALEAQREMIRSSRWLKLGRKIGVGPEL